jgi:hypothetical protein
MSAASIVTGKLPDADSPLAVGRAATLVVQATLVREDLGERYFIMTRHNHTRCRDKAQGREDRGELLFGWVAQEGVYKESTTFSGVQCDVWFRTGTDDWLAVESANPNKPVVLNEKRTETHFANVAPFTPSADFFDVPSACGGAKADDDAEPSDDATP